MSHPNFNFPLIIDILGPSAVTDKFRTLSRNIKSRFSFVDKKKHSKFFLSLKPNLCDFNQFLKSGVSCFANLFQFNLSPHRLHNCAIHDSNVEDNK